MAENFDGFPEDIFVSEQKQEVSARPVKPEITRPVLVTVNGEPQAPFPEQEADEENCPTLSQDHIAREFVNSYGNDWKYVKAWHKWLRWDGKTWRRDDTGRIDREMVLQCRRASNWNEAMQLSADGKRKIASKATAWAVKEMSAVHLGVAATVEQWDADTWLLGTPSGTIDLRTGETREAKREDYITRRCSVTPAPGPKPVWDRFINTFMGENTNLVQYLQRLGGYCLTGETTNQCFTFLYGTGQNGKGVFLKTLQEIMGDYAAPCDAGTFMEQKNERHTQELACLHGVRAAIVDETDSSHKWNEERIKRVTGGAPIDARFMGQNNFRFMPQFKLLVAGNHKPQIKGVGKAMARRLHLVPCTVTVADKDRDDLLQEKLRAEYPQILQWFIEGCNEWRKTRLAPPDEITAATSDYMTGEDVIGDWLETRTKQGPGLTVKRNAAYLDYKKWNEAQGGDYPWSARRFFGGLEEKGLSMTKNLGERDVLGIELKQALPQEDEPPEWAWGQGPED